MSSILSTNSLYLVLGAGVTGVAVANFFNKNGYNYYIYDDNYSALSSNANIPDKVKLKEYDEKFLDNIDYLVISPGFFNINNQHPVIDICKKLDVKVITDIDIFFDYLSNYQNKTTIGITGTNGKSTTVSLLSHILNSFNLRSVTCGNIGISVLDIDIEQYDYFVIELSSYQLALSSISCDYGVILNITPDHIREHGSFEHYTYSKTKLLLNSKKRAFVNYDNSECREIYDLLKAEHKSVFRFSTESKIDITSYENGSLYYGDSILENVNFINLPGKHNMENVVASLSICYELNLDFHRSVDSIRAFVPLQDRLQFIRAIDNVSFWNDSKATNADATKFAISSFDSDVYLIAGGRRKKDGFLEIRQYLTRVKKVYLIGEASDSFASELSSLGVDYVSSVTMNNAVRSAFLDAKNDRSNAVVLLSPLCSSWDQYKNFHERGNDFIDCVSALSKI